MNFVTIQRAGQTARQQSKDEEVDVVLKYDEPDCELALNPVYCV